jgi:uncharacterized protein YdaL
MSVQPRRHRGIPAIAMVAVVAVLLAGCARPRPATDTAGSRPTGTLVLYDTTGPYAFLGELCAMQAGNLASHFGTWTAHPVARYQAGEAASYRAVIYIGSTYDEPLPITFLDDVVASTRPVLWLNDNIWQLTARHPQLAARLGFRADGFDTATVTEVRYKGTALTRDAANTAGIMRLTVTNPARATAVAVAVHADGTSVPWGVRSGPFTYLGELPFAYLTPDDRYLAFADLLFDALAPTTATRHRALVRIEDVGPQSDPAQLRSIADYLAGRGVPFAVAVFVEYDDPAGRYSGGKPVHRRLSDTPGVVAALKYMVAHGATLVAHGDTHAYAGGPNPYGVSAEDFEFYRAHVNAANSVVLDGPVPEDSAAWAAARIADARAEWAKVGLPAPGIFEFPHYSASAVDYRTVSAAIPVRYERAMYFSGVLSGATVDHSRYASQFFPYPVRDVYGAAVIPETLGNVETQGYNQHEARLPAEILASARRQLVVRDGVASFFYHPFLGLRYLPSLVDGIQSLGYTFVPATAEIQPAPPGR